MGLSSSASKSLEFLNIDSMRVCFLQYDLVGLRSIYESVLYFENSSQSLHLKSI